MNVCLETGSVMTVQIPMMDELMILTLKEKGHFYKVADASYVCVYDSDIFSWNETLHISIQISPKFVPDGPIDNKSALV